MTGRGKTPRNTLVGSEADLVLQTAVLLEAGVAPLRAWEYLAATGEPAAGRIVASVADGMTVAQAISELATVEETPRRLRLRSEAMPPQQTVWQDVGAAWQVATTVGAPLAPSLRALASALRDGRETADDVRVALAEPAGTARLMGWLPLVAIGLGTALGFDTVTILVTEPAGIVCAVAGLVLVVAAHRWTGALVARARTDVRVPGLGADLMAIALTGGVSMDRARAIVGAADVDIDPAVEAYLRLSKAAGVPARELLRAGGALARHRARIDGKMRAARLSSRLLLPLGVCTLPAFLLLGVAPMLLGVMSTMSLNF
ncbi:type II secretion system F family protein [Microbacterium sp. C7(2022)]|uniref:type II secretion system F family protein n=1 Tax=Microbacterium sp. C7(2022) TaxID=2992759 RepID=UPI00237A193E|nr:type II secretion system F family protein [Microbacterium sp. C7(2022)]MDE0546008.1 type II secretion system F family protein [Microbacterium sp. C7(2022)]